MDQLSLLVISAIINGVLTAIALYIGMYLGTRKTVDVVIDKLQERFGNSPTAQRLIKAIETSDKLFGDDQAIEQITRFFKVAGDLLTSPEAKSFFKTLTATATLPPPKKKQVKKLA